MVKLACPPPVARKLLVSYVLPRMLHGLETLILTKGNMETLEVCYKQLLRDLMALRKNVANEAVYLLFGLPPIEAELDIRMLNLFGAVCRLPDNSPIYRIARSQVAMRTSKPRSWFTRCLDTAKKYDLEQTLVQAIINPLSKEDWKKKVSSPIRTFWRRDLVDRASQRSSLRYFNPYWTPTWAAHHIWPIASASRAKRIAAAYRAKMLAGTYILQATRERYNQHRVDPACPLCGAEREDLVHFLIHCPALEHIRCPLFQKLVTLMTRTGQLVCHDSTDLCVLILNAGSPVDVCARLEHRTQGGLGPSPDRTVGACISPPHKIGSLYGNPSVRVCLSCRAEAEIIRDTANSLCYRLHNQRSALLAKKQEAPNKRRNHHT